MLRRVVFYNCWGNGDIHIARNYTRYIVENIPAEEYIYYTLKPTKLLADIPKLRLNNDLNQFLLNSYPENYGLARKDKGFLFHNRDFLCNTWICAYGKRFYRGTCDFPSLFNLFYYGLQECFEHDLPGNVSDYFPTINYENFEIQRAKEYLLRDKRKKVLICNSDVMSGQSVNFDFNPIIDMLARRHEQEDVVFIISNSVDKKLSRDNVVYAQDILKIEGNDLNEISFISRSCDVIVGRNSGAYSFSVVNDNIFDTRKIFISFASQMNPGDFGLSRLLAESKRAKFVLSHTFELKTMVDLISTQLES